MLSKEMNAALNRQVMMEAESSMAYLAMASWAEQQAGLDGVTGFFYLQSDEERLHMLKLIKFINERGGSAEIPALEKPLAKFDSVKEVFSHFLQHEFKVSESINELVETALKARDYATHSFLQWYVNEQMEEEHVARQLNDKLELIGEDKSGLYLFDRDILQQASATEGTTKA
jgi:ferritin